MYSCEHVTVISLGQPCEMCGAPSVCVWSQVDSSATNHYRCARHNPLAYRDGWRDAAESLSEQRAKFWTERDKLRAALRQAREALREVAADDDPRDGCAHSDCAKATLAKIAEVLLDD